MWRDIALANRENLSQALRTFMLGLQDFTRALKAADAPALGAFFDTAKQRRDQWSEVAGVPPRIEVHPSLTLVPLPSLIEIVPLDKPVQAQITVPGSKSITNRALVLAALAEGVTTLQGALWSEDTRVMAACLEQLGFTIPRGGGPRRRPAIARSRSRGKAAGCPPGASRNSRSSCSSATRARAARFVAALVCRGRGVYRLDGVRRMRERPQAPLFRALRELGCRVDSPNDKLPAVIYGQGARPGKCRVSLEESSQFASALLLSGRDCWEIELVGANPDEQPSWK